MKKNLFTYSLLFVSLILITGCLAGANSAAGTADISGDIAGFWDGLWHGIIAPVTFVLSLITDNIHMYEIHNNGGWYDFGFVVGAGILFGGGSKASCKKRR